MMSLVLEQSFLGGGGGGDSAKERRLLFSTSPREREVKFWKQKVYGPEAKHIVVFPRRQWKKSEMVP